MCHEQTNDPERCSFCHYTAPEGNAHPTDFITAHGKLAWPTNRTACAVTTTRRSSATRATPSPARSLHRRLALLARPAGRSRTALCAWLPQLTRSSASSATRSAIRTTGRRSHAPAAAKGTASCMVCHPPSDVRDCHREAGGGDAVSTTVLAVPRLVRLSCSVIALRRAGRTPPTTRSRAAPTGAVSSATPARPGTIEVEGETKSLTVTPEDDPRFHPRAPRLHRVSRRLPTEEHTAAKTTPAGISRPSSTGLQGLSRRPVRHVQPVLPREPGDEGGQHRRAPSCADCHGSHDIVSPSCAGVSRARCRPMCGRCHGEQSRAPTWTPTTARRSVWARPRAVCTDCHGHHRILPRVRPDSWVSDRNVAQTCGKCHATRAQKFASFLVHVDRSHPEVVAVGVGDGDQPHPADHRALRPRRAALLPVLLPRPQGGDLPQWQT